jgi:hypothetical protein
LVGFLLAIVIKQLVDIVQQFFIIGTADFLNDTILQFDCFHISIFYSNIQNILSLNPKKELMTYFYLNRNPVRANHKMAAVFIVSQAVAYGRGYAEPSAC